MPKVNVEVWVLVDTSGDCGTGTTEEEAAEDYANRIDGSLAGSRMLKVKLSVDMPAVTELSGDVPGIGEAVQLVVDPQ